MVALAIARLRREGPAMHVQTHLMCGWCLGNLLRLTPRQRLLCMLAASVPDLDGLGILISQDLYWDMHHVVGHSAAFGAVLATALALVPQPRRLLGLSCYLALFHLHLGMDLLGSGEGWTIAYLWPFSGLELEYSGAWALFSWQNLSAAGALLAWTMWIAAQRDRTPLEVIMPSLDAKIAAWVIRCRDRLAGRRAGGPASPVVEAQPR
jgi:hypothetical protein